MTMICWDLFQLNGQDFIIAKTNKGVSCIDRLTENNQWKKTIKRHRPQVRFEKSNLAEEIAEVLAYFQGDITSFSFPIDLIGTAFQVAVWEATLAIPYGETMTYGELAQVIDRSNAIRAVGSALAANHLLFVVPCHRVIAKNGQLTGYRAGMDWKARLLRLENKAFTPK